MAERKLFSIEYLTDNRRIDQTSTEYDLENIRILLENKKKKSLEFLNILLQNVENMLNDLLEESEDFFTTSEFGALYRKVIKLLHQIETASLVSEIDSLSSEASKFIHQMNAVLHKIESGTELVSRKRSSVQYRGDTSSQRKTQRKRDVDSCQRELGTGIDPKTLI